MPCGIVVSLLDLLDLNMVELTDLAWVESVLLAVDDLEFRVLWRDTVGSSAVEYSVESFSFTNLRGKDIILV